MSKPAARLGDMVLQDSPHCHAPIHPPAGYAASQRPGVRWPFIVPLAR